MYKIMKRRKKGMTLIEMIIAVAIMAIVFGGIMQGLNASILATQRDSEINSALHLAQSQMEHIKALPYDDQAPFEYDIITDIPEGYDIEVTVEPTYDDGIQGMQSVTVTVSYQGKSTILHAYKINR